MHQSKLRYNNVRVNQPFLYFLQVLILFSPLPFGCVGKFWWPLFYLLLVILTLIGLRILNKQHGGRWPEDSVNSGQESGRQINFKKWRVVFYIFLGFLTFQLVPIPLFLLKIISPQTVATLSQLKDRLPAFHPLSLVPYETLVFGLKFLVLGLFFGVVIRLKWRKRQIVSILNTVVLSAFLQTVLGLAKYLMGNRYFFLFFYPQPPDDYSRFLTGTLGNPNHFAFYLEMIVPLALALFLTKMAFFEEDHPPWREKILLVFDLRNKLVFYFCSVLLMIVGIILTGARAGIVTLLLSMLLFGQFAIYLRGSRAVRNKFRWIFFAVALVATLVGVQDTITKFKASPFQGAGRMVRWPDTLEMAVDFPLAGTGFGTYRYAFFLYDSQGKQWSTHAHNDYLEVLAEGGVLGAAVLLLLLGMVIYTVFNRWWQRRHPEVRMLGLGIAVGLFAAIFHSFFDFALRIPSNMFMLVLILSLGVKIVTYRKRGSR
jgi:O-antigen ligase